MSDVERLQEMLVQAICERDEWKRRAEEWQAKAEEAYARAAKCADDIDCAECHPIVANRIRALAKGRGNP